jgi:hypothetical protein
MVRRAPSNKVVVHILRSFLIQGWRSSVKARHFVLYVSFLSACNREYAIVLMDSALHDYFFEKLRDTNLQVTADNDSVRAISPAPSTRSSESGTGTDSVSDVFHDALSSHRAQRKEHDRWYVGYLNMLRYALFVETHYDSHVYACRILRVQPLIECFDDDGTGGFDQCFF